MSEGGFSITYRDYDNEIGVVGVRMAEISDLVVSDPLITAAINAIDAVVLGNKVSTRRSYKVDTLGSGASTDNDAQRERKWRVLGYDSVTYDPVKLELPCANRAFLYDSTYPPNVRDQMNQGSAEYATLVGTLQAIMTSNAGNPVTITKVIMVGANT